MAIDFKRTKVSGHFPEIWRGECKILPAGFKPAQSFPVGTVLRRGTPITVDFEKRTAAVAKTAEVLKGGTTTAPRVPKGHYFTVGDVVTKLGDGKASPSIKSIDTTNDDYDTITLSAAYTGLAENNVIVESNEITSGVTEAKPLYTPNMVVGADLEFTGKGIPTIDAAYEAVVLYPSLNFPIIADWLTGCCLKANHNILFIKQ
jgi:hypothetical protein